jgi:aspartate/methionine/tyrosine aminotransferase
VIQAIKESLSDPMAHQYQSYQGLPALRSAISEFYQTQYGVSLDPESEVLPLMGSKEGIMHLSMAYLNEGDQVLIPNPGYPTYTSVTRLLGAEPVYYDLTAQNNWLPDLNAIAAMDLSRVKIMWLSYPHMPTGAHATAAYLQPLIDLAKSRGFLLAMDNPYSFILNNHPMSILSLQGAMEVAVELNSLSKTANMAGWRVGMICGNQEHLKAVLQVKSNMDSGMFYGIQRGAIQALKAPASWYASLNETYALRRDKVWAFAEALGCAFDRNAVGMFVWARLPEGITDECAFVDQLLYQHHIFITPGSIFGSNGAGYVRFSLCLEADLIDQAIQRIKS